MSTYSPEGAGGGRETIVSFGVAIHAHNIRTRYILVYGLQRAIVIVAGRSFCKFLRHSVLGTWILTNHIAVFSHTP